MGTSRLSMLLGGACALVLGTLFKFRILPFLKGDTILSGGRPMPTEEFAEFGARWFYIFGTASILGALIWGPSEPERKKHEHPIAERTGCSGPLPTMIKDGKIVDAPLSDRATLGYKIPEEMLK